MKTPAFLMTFLLASTSCFSQAESCKSFYPLVSEIYSFEMEQITVPPCSAFENTFFSTLKDVASMHESHLRTPVTLMLSKEGPGAGYTSPGWIFIPLLMKLGATKYSVKEYQTIIAHEYGHHYFFNLFFKQYSGSELFIKRSEIIDLNKSLVKMNHDFNLLADDEKETKLREHRNAVDKVKSRIQFLANENSRLPITEKIMSVAPYSELYADAVAILHQNDLKAMSQAQQVGFPVGYEDQHESYRDFSKIHSIENWEVDDSHSLFAPVRSYLGNFLKNKNLNTEQKKEFLSILYEAISNQFAANQLTTKQSPKTMNVELINELDHPFKQLNF